MLVASVHDPALFTEDCQNDPAVRSALIDHVMHMAHCHIPVVDREGVLGQALLKDLKNLPAHIVQLLNALVSDASRVVRLDVPAAALQALKEYLPDISARAMAMAECKGVDAVVASRDGFEAAGLANIQKDHVYSLSTYAESDAKRREFAAMGAVSLNGMLKQDFCENVIGPVVRWANKVILIDRWLAQSFFDNHPSSPEGSNWPRFKRTIRSICHTWRRDCQVGEDSFELVSLPCNKWNKPWQDDWRAEGLQNNYKKQAEQIGTDLGLGPRIKIRLIALQNQEEDDLTLLNHDRYLVTNRNTILNFTRGFDLIRSDNTLIEVAVSLYKEPSRGSVSRLLTARNLAVWDSEA